MQTVKQQILAKLAEVEALLVNATVDNIAYNTQEACFVEMQEAVYKAQELVDYYVD